MIFVVLMMSDIFVPSAFWDLHTSVLELTNSCGLEIPNSENVRIAPIMRGSAREPVHICMASALLLSNPGLLLSINNSNE